jgi:hypothetical protein
MLGLNKDKAEEVPETDEEKLVRSIKLGILAMHKGFFYLYSGQVVTKHLWQNLQVWLGARSFQPCNFSSACHFVNLLKIVTSNSKLGSLDLNLIK